MNGNEILVAVGYGLIAFGLIGCVVWLICFLFRRQQLKKGVYGINRSNRILQRYAVLRNYKVLRNITIKVGNKTAHIDNLLIGFFGLVFFKNMDRPGQYYGDAKKTQWIYSKDKIREQITNPVLQNEADIDVVRTLFSKHNIYKMQMESYTVFHGRPKKTELFLSPNQPVMFYGELHKHLQKTKYDQDRDVSVDEIAKLILENTVQ